MQLQCPDGIIWTILCVLGTGIMIISLTGGTDGYLRDFSQSKLFNIMFLPRTDCLMVKVKLVSINTYLHKFECILNALEDTQLWCFNRSNSISPSTSSPQSIPTLCFMQCTPTPRRYQSISHFTDKTSLSIFLQQFPWQCVTSSVCVCVLCMYVCEIKKNRDTKTQRSTSQNTWLKDAEPLNTPTSSVQRHRQKY